MSKRPFKRAVVIASDAIPEHMKQPINDLCAEFLIRATCINYDDAVEGKKVKFRDFNVSLGAIQKALGLLIQEFFDESQRDMVIEQVCDALRRSRWNTGER